MPLDGETFDLLLDTIRRFVAERLRPLEGKIDRDDAVPEDVVQEMRDMGLFGLSIPEEYGGLGLSMAEEVRVALELGRTTPAFRSVFGTNVGIGSQGLVMAGSEAQKAEWLPRIATGEIITSFALTEPGAGSDSASVQTRAVRDGDVYRLSGGKRYITNADKASLFTVMARTGGEGARGVPLSSCLPTFPASASASLRRRWAAGRPCLRRQFRRRAGARRQPARRGRRGVQDRDAGAGPRPPPHRRRLRRHRRAAHRGRGRLCH
jgi:alkylation response protein AidB-like acyl-CoA dehydrogenase